MHIRGLWRSFLLVSGLVSAGCSFEEPKLHTEQLDFREAPQSLSIDVGSGDLRLRGAAVDRVFVTAKVQGPKNHVGYDLNEQSLTVFDDCHEEPCSVDLSFEVPLDMAVTLKTGSGDVWLENARGDLSLHTGSGDITGVDLGGTNFVAETGSGDVRCGFSPAEFVNLRTGSGDVLLTVPRGVYSLDVSTGSGDQKLQGVSNDAGAERKIEVSTGSGDLKITGI